MGKSIGIDLGTTNSVACYYDGRTARVLLNTFHEELTPSVVGYERLEEGDEGEYLVGRPAVNQARLNPRDTIFSIKRLMGRKYADDNVQQCRARVTYTIVESKEPVAGLAAVELAGQQCLPEQVSARILSEIKKYSEAALGDEVRHAVITVPAYFGEPERAATREAGRLAGLVVKTLLPEPTAAAIAFGTQIRSEEGSFLLVYDLGGGTFDISIISLVGDNYNVMKIHGDHFLGGDDFDEKIVRRILDHVKAKHQADLADDSRFRILARREAEAAKKALSAPSTDSVNIRVPEAARVDGKTININLKVTREEFEHDISALVDNSVKLVREALEQQSLGPELISDVLLVGGSTAIPLVYQAMADLFGKDKIRKDVNPMHCVAIGAGILAHRMKGIECPGCRRVCDESEQACPGCGAPLAAARSVVEGMQVTEITANRFGIQVVSGSDAHHFKTLVEEGTPLPMKEPAIETFFTTEEDQRHIRVPVYEGRGSNVLQNTLIGVIEYPLPQGLPINHPVRVEFQLDRQSIVALTIEVEGKGLRHEQRLKRVSEAEGEAEGPEEAPLVEEEEEDGDVQQKQLAILEIYVNQARRFTEEYGGILTAAQTRKVGEAVQAGQALLDDEKGDEAMAAIMKLDQLLNRCGTASLIEQAHLAADSADEDTAERLHGAAKELKVYAERNDRAMVEKLSAPVASLIRQVHKAGAGVDRIGAAQSFGGLLRHGKKTGQS